MVQHGARVIGWCKILIGDCRDVFAVHSAGFMSVVYHLVPMVGHALDELAGGDTKRIGPVAFAGYARGIGQHMYGRARHSDARAEE